MSQFSYDNPSSFEVSTEFVNSYPINIIEIYFHVVLCRSAIFSALDSGASGLGSIPGRGHCMLFLGKTLYSHSASLRPSV